MNKKVKQPFLSPLAIIFLLLVFTVVISWIFYWCLPKDKYDIHPAGILEVFTAPISGFINSTSTLIFIMVVGAYMNIVQTSKSLDSLISTIFKKLKNKELFFIGFIFILFALLGSFLGAWSVMALPFYFLLIPLLCSAGYDKFTSMLLVFFASEIGVFGSTINPILINNAIESTNQACQETVVVFSDGIIWRFVCFFILTSVGLTFSLIYAKKHRNINVVNSGNIVIHITNKTMTGNKKATLWIMLITFVLMFIGMFPWDNISGLNGFEILGNKLAIAFPYFAGQSINQKTGEIVSNIANIGSWSLIEVSFLFFISSFITALINWKGEKEYGNQFIKGMEKMIPVVLLISLASGISCILNETGIQDILINSFTNISGMNPTLLTFLLFIVLIVVSLFIPSLAALTKAVYPTLGPSLANSGTKMSISGSILCTAFGNGVVHMFLPVSTTLIYGLNECNISFKDYYKKIWPIMLVILGLSLTLLLIGSVLPNNIF